MIIGPQQPGAEFHTMWPPSATGPAIGTSGPSRPSVKVSTTTVRRDVVSIAISVITSGYRYEQRDLLAVGQDVIAGHVLAGHDRKHGAQGRSEIRLVVSEPCEQSATVAPSATSTVLNGAAESPPAPRRTRIVTLPQA